MRSNDAPSSSVMCGYTRGWIKCAQPGEPDAEFLHAAGRKVQGRPQGEVISAFPMLPSRPDLHAEG